MHGRPSVTPTPQIGDTPAPSEPTTEPLPAGQGRGGSLEPRTSDDPVDEASDESFPASDAPAWAA